MIFTTTTLHHSAFADVLRPTGGRTPFLSGLNEEACRYPLILIGEWLIVLKQKTGVKQIMMVYPKLFHETLLTNDLDSIIIHNVIEHQEIQH